MEEAIIVAFLRGKAVSQHNTKGLMLAVGSGEADVRLEIENRFPNVTVACQNSPKSVTLSGDANEILGAKDFFQARRVFTRLVATGGNAYHSAQMRELGPAYESAMTENFRLSSPDCSFLPDSKFVSSVTGNLEVVKNISPGYWRRNLESPVLFSGAIQTLLQTISVNTFLEIGPHSSLHSSLQQIAHSRPDTSFPQYISTLQRGKNSTNNILCTAGTLWCTGHLVNLERINAVESVDSTGTLSLENGNVIADLPRYQWQYDKPLYRENRWTREWRLRKHSRHDILGSRMPGGIGRVSTWRNILRHKDLKWLGDHRVSISIPV